MGQDPGLGRRGAIAKRLGLEESSTKRGQFEGRCPECSRDSFSIKGPDKSKLLHIWTCAASKSCSAEIIRAAMLRRGIQPGWLGGYGSKVSNDPHLAARVEAAVRDIIAAPGLKPADIRIVLAEALGLEVPGDYRAFIGFAQSIGIGRTQAYEAASRWACRPSGSPPPEGGSADAKS